MPIVLIAWLDFVRRAIDEDAAQHLRCTTTRSRLLIAVVPGAETWLARLNPPPNLPPILSSDGLVVDRGFVTAEERPALLAYLRKQ